MADVLLQIRGVPEQTRRRLKTRAASRGQSLNAYLLEMINREAARPTVSEVLERARRRTERATVSAVDATNAARREREGELEERGGT